MSSSTTVKKSVREIEIRGARVHNLKNISLTIPQNKLVVITGLSGSGKSSLAFDTLYAEGQRRYVESLSSYARQFLGKIEKPDVDSIKGIAPAIAIEQKVISNNPRSTVGTVTEIYDYLKLMFARIGKTISPVSGKEVKRHIPEDVLDHVQKHPAHWFMLMFVWHTPKGKKFQPSDLDIISQHGYSRVFDGKEVHRIDELLKAPEKIKLVKTCYVVIDRVQWDDSEETMSRILDSAEIAFDEGQGECLLFDMETQKIHSFSNRFELDGITFDEPSVNMFTFNNPVGACKTCEGFGNIIGINPELVFPDKSKSVYQDAIAPWKGNVNGEFKQKLIQNASKFDFPIHKPIQELTPEQYDLLWDGNSHFTGINDFFYKIVEPQMYKIQYRVFASRFRGKTFCPDCKGTRIKKSAGYVKVGGKSIHELVLMPVEDLKIWIDDLKLSKNDQQAASRIFTELSSRIGYLNQVGLGYLTLNRQSGSLSGGESQRVQLATTLGSSLVGSLYILDEPSIGLHATDTHRLVDILISLRDLGNTVIVVEHDEDIMKAADLIIDMGPDAGFNGGEIVFQGTHDMLPFATNSHTADYLTGRNSIPVPSSRRQAKQFIQIEGAAVNNIKNLNVKFPLQCLVAVTGVSGSGKSSLVRHILQPALQQHLGVGWKDGAGYWNKVFGDLKAIKRLEVVDQNPIGKSSRSNPATFIDAFTDMRMIFADLPASKAQGLQPGHFSFNIPGGRCETCEGEGVQHIEMQFMADIHLTCETCKGKRFQDFILDVKYHGHSISDILELTIDETVALFSAHNSRLEQRVAEKLGLLIKVGLGYLKTGQPSNTLSGGEAQRIKLASFLNATATNDPTLFIFDEPTTGLHFHDVRKLLVAFDELLRNGHSIVVIEHHPDVIKYADWLIDIGPGAGYHGGTIVYEGTPEGLLICKASKTRLALQGKL